MTRRELAATAAAAIIGKQTASAVTDPITRGQKRMMELKDNRWQFTDEAKAIIENLKQAEDSELRQREENLGSVIEQALMDVKDDRVDWLGVESWMIEVLNHRWPLRRLSWAEKEFNETEDYYANPNSRYLKNVDPVEREMYYQRDISRQQREISALLTSRGIYDHASGDSSNCEYLRKIVDGCTHTKEERAEYYAKLRQDPRAYD